MKQPGVMRLRMRARRARAGARERGISTIWLALSIVLMLLFVSLAVDIFWAVLVGYQLSVGADAASLAGAMEVRRSRGGARSQAVLLASENHAAGEPIEIRRNDANMAEGEVVIGRYRRRVRLFTPLDADGSGQPNAVRVRAMRTEGSLGGRAPTIFSGAFGLTGLDIQRDATAMIGGDIGPAILALNPSDGCTFDMRGSSGLVRASDGLIVVDSDHPLAACRSGPPTIDVLEMHVVGGVEEGLEESVTGEVFEDASYVPDPLAALPEPNAPTTSYGNVRINNGTIMLEPGRYRDISINGGDVTLNAGLYYIEGKLQYNGGNIDGTAGVMLFIGPRGKLDFAGNGSMHLVGMSPTSYPNGPTVPESVAGIQVPIFQSRSNGDDAEVNGTADWELGGTIYIPSATLLLRGTPGTFANGLVADKIQTRGTEDIVIDYQNQFPPVPRFVFLVE